MVTDDGWTLQTLYEHLSRVQREADKRYEQRFVAQEKAVGTALTSQKEIINAALVAKTQTNWLIGIMVGIVLAAASIITGILMRIH